MMSEPKGEEVFVIEKWWKHYLELCKLSHLNVHSVQYKQLHHAFFAAWGMLLFVSRDNMSRLDDDKAIEKLDSMLKQAQEGVINTGNYN